MFSSCFSFCDPNDDDMPRNGAVFPANIVTKGLTTVPVDDSGNPSVPQQKELERISSRQEAMANSKLRSSRDFLKAVSIEHHARLWGSRDFFNHQINFDEEEEDAKYLASEDPAEFQKTEDETRFIEEAFARNKNIVFDNLTTGHLRTLIDGMKLVQVEANTTIFHRGQLGSHFHLMKDGTIAVYLTDDDKIGCMDEDEIGDGDKFEDGDEIGDGDHLGNFSLPNQRKTAKSIMLIPPTTGDISEKFIPEKPFLPQPTKEENTTHLISKPPKSIITPSAANQRKHIIFPGEIFGALSLLYGTPNIFTFVALTKCSLWTVSGDTFRRVMKPVLKNRMALCSADCQHCALGKEFLKSIPMFSAFDRDMLCKVARSLMPAKYVRGERIIKRGQAGTTFYIIKKGIVRFHNFEGGDSAHMDVTLGKGEFFGEKSLLTGEKRAASATAHSDKVELLVMGREEFEKNLGPLQELIDRALQKKRLVSVLFSTPAKHYYSIFLINTIGLNITAFYCVVYGGEDVLVHITHCNFHSTGHHLWISSDLIETLTTCLLCHTHQSPYFLPISLPPISWLSPTLQTQSLKTMK